MNSQQEDHAETGTETGAETGTARVRRVLLAPLAGLARPKGVPAGVHDANLARLAGRLSYMDEGPLAGLVELCLGHAGALVVERAARPVCPNEGVILAWAYALQPPPVRRSDYAASVMRSALGRRAFDGGYGVELLRAARRFGPPPGAYTLTRLQDEARENAWRRAAMRAEIEAGNSLPPEMVRWLEAWHADAVLVEQLMVEGDERRAARGAA